jgi:AcrR family transcriptional regulator
MKPEVRLARPVRKRPRRSHAERTAETRAKVLAAVVDTIAAVGYQRTTAQAIANRAGVTWGAVQHHFGGKDELLLAVLEDTFTRFAERMTDIAAKKTPMEDRVSLFIDRAWEHFRSRHFRTAFEILLDYLGRDEHPHAAKWREQMTRAWDRVWSEIFADARVPRSHSLMLQHYTVATLSGLATMSIMEGGAVSLSQRELHMLKDTLVRSMSGAA